MGISEFDHIFPAVSTDTIGQIDMLQLPTVKKKEEKSVNKCAVPDNCDHRNTSMKEGEFKCDQNYSQNVFIYF